MTAFSEATERLVEAAREAARIAARFADGGARSVCFTDIHNLLRPALAAYDAATKREAGERSDGERLAKYRADGWMVAIHNDYFLNGERYTFWLLTRPEASHFSSVPDGGRYVKGEGRTDADAFDVIDAAIDAEEGKDGG